MTVEVQETIQGEGRSVESFDGEYEISESKTEKYLGQIVSSDGSNVKNVTNLSNKGKGMVNTVTSIMNRMPGGKFHFEMAVMMRNISSMLS